MFLKQINPVGVHGRISGDSLLCETPGGLMIIKIHRAEKTGVIVVEAIFTPAEE